MNLRNSAEHVHPLGLFPDRLHAVTAKSSGRLNNRLRFIRERRNPRLSRSELEEIMNVLSSEERFDVHRSITEAIVSAIEAGAGEFVMPWHGSSAEIAKPMNAHTQANYQGINVLALWAEACAKGFASGYWASYKQWQQLGAQVMSGQRGTTIVFYKTLNRDIGDEDEEDGRRHLVARAYRVFNADQVNGWQPPQPEQALESIQVLEAVADFVAATEATVDHTNAGGAFYDLRLDRIVLPFVEHFVGSPTSSPTEAYHATLLHELVHWSGAKHRLDRGLLSLSRTERAREELIAEIGAAFLCADLGVANEPRPDHAAYVASWLQLLRNDSRAVFTASRLAHQAAIYLHGLAEQEVQ